MKKAIKLLAFTEILVIASYFSSFAYKKMVNAQVEADIVEEKRDFLDELEDPHGLYDDEPINEAPAEELDLKTIVQEEKNKIKLVNFKDMKNGSKAGFSLFRLVPYLFLVLGFIALKNNELLDIFIYLPSLLVGIIVGYVSGKEIFA
ncbi:MAG: hypothetical protein NTZ60_02945 [Campylobacterales bacterium]|nr:hypothetical protein [Campylobacterales bacterium]